MGGSATTDRRLGLTGSQAIKTPCLCATTANITLSGEQTIDSVTTSGSRVLVKNQTAGADNGVYVSDTGTWERDLDFDGTEDALCGTLVFVTNGSSNGAGLFQLTTANPLTIGSTALTFTKIATLAAGAVTQVNVQNGQLVECTSIAGTNTITGTTSGTAPSALGHGQYVFFIPVNINTGAATFNRDGLGAVNIFYDGAALIGGELQLVPALLFHDGTQYNLMTSAHQNMNYQTQGSVASASTVNLDTAKPYTQITGAVQINAITLGNGRVRVVEFASTPVVANSSSLVCVTGANLTMAAGDVCVFAGEAAGVVRMLVLQRANGASSNYQEGIWTPTLAGETTAGTQTYSTQTGRYTKTGRLWFVEGSIVMTAKDAATAGNLVIGGLPASPSSSVTSPTGGITIGTFSNMIITTGFSFLSLDPSYGTTAGTLRFRVTGGSTAAGSGPGQSQFLSSGLSSASQVSFAGFFTT